MPENISNPKIAFIVGRPSGHPIHMDYGQSVGADVYHEDRILRWQDIEESSKLRRYVSWLANAFCFPKRKSYDLFLCECLRVPPLIMKCIGIMNKRQKLVALMADESLYFLDQHKYPAMTRQLMRLFLKKCDYLICIGDLQYELACKHTPPGSAGKIYKIANGLEPELLSRLLNIQPVKRTVGKLVVIANISTEWRAWYKGVDIALQAFDAYCTSHDLELDVIGAVDENVAKSLTSGLSETTRSKISFKGMVSDIAAVLPDYDLCLHPSRGDAFPTSTLECFAAGIPTIVSNVTGTKGFLQPFAEPFICEPTAESVKKALEKALQLTMEQRMEISHQLKNRLRGCTQEESRRQFKEIIHGILSAG